jgi:hypothetical protein
LGSSYSDIAPQQEFLSELGKCLSQALDLDKDPSLVLDAFFDKAEKAEAIASDIDAAKNKEDLPANSDGELDQAVKPTS